MSTKTAAVYAAVVIGIGILEACSKDSPADTETRMEQVVRDANAPRASCLPGKSYLTTKTRYE